MRSELERQLRFLVSTKPSTEVKTALSLMHELIYEPVDLEDIIGGTLLSPSKSEKFSVNDILDSVYGPENSYAKSQITELGNVKNMSAHQVLNLGKGLGALTCF